MSVQVERWCFTVAEYHRMMESGILSEDDRVELIEGEIIKMSPIGSRHASCVKRLNNLLNHAVGQTAIVGVQDPVRLDEYSEPQPDIALLRPRNDFYAHSHPTPDDMLLIIEVADTSVEYDRDVKLPLYAQAGIPEVWLVNLIRDAVEAYSQPVNGAYQMVREFQHGGTLTPETLPQVAFNVEDVLG
ncbi:MAG TPA: Uma2 family endonuclease [Blastocatellia bacterium]|nr:Uma2 family endonuclease [Blastocatellia bacterium]